MSSLKSDTRVAARGDILSCDVGDDGAVLLDPREGVYLGVEGPGALLWATLAQGPASVAELCDAVAADYEISAEACADDVRAFVDDLLRRDLVTLLPEDGPAHGE